MKFILLVLCLFCGCIAFSQDGELTPYNDTYNYEILTNERVLPHTDSLKALIVVFKDQPEENVAKSITNNLQLQEIMLYNSPASFLPLLAGLKLSNLTHLFIYDFEGKELIIPPFPTIEHLQIESGKISTLSMENASLANLDILSIDCPELVNWKTEKVFSKLGLIDLTAPKLTYFPIESIPVIVQFAYYCSFDQLPLNLCSYKELQFISFTNYKPVEIESCFKKMVKNGVYSDITIYDKIDGKVIKTVLSKDHNEVQEEPPQKL
ncbi:MAG: hypothetical protein ACO1N0_10570 [Fluviicola sp.]